MDMNPFRKLGREVRETSKELASRSDTVENARARVLRAWKPNRKTLARQYGLAASVVVTLVIGVAMVVFPQHPAITYVIGSGGTPGSVGAWIAAAAEETELRFSEGTQLTLQRETRARVAYADERGARVVLERGSLKANVVHASASTSWNIDAGPFEVHVVGTAFDVTWDPSRETFVLVMREGRVVVQGPSLGEGRVLTRGEELRVDVAQQRSAARQTTSKTRTDQPLADEPVLVAEIEPAEAMAEFPLDPPSKVPTANPIPLWRQLAAQGKHDEAMRALESEGMDEVLANASVDVLFEIANEARFAKQYDRAEDVLLRARRKGASGRSAFLLGKIAMDHRHAPKDAIAWFKIYMSEVPSGGLAEQALARLLELQQATNDMVGARQTADEYLLRFPRGSHAALARTLVDP